MKIREAAASNLAGCTLLLPIEAGGLSNNGTLDSASQQAFDVADEVSPRHGSERRNQKQDAPQLDTPLPRLRVVLRSGEGGWLAEYVSRSTEVPLFALPQGDFKDWQTLRRKVLVATQMSCSHSVSIREDEELGPSRVLLYLVDPKTPGSSGETEQTLDAHTLAVVKTAERIGKALDLDEPVHCALILAARCHDLGKNRRLWQRYARNSDLSRPLAKSPAYLDSRFLAGYRHEFGSLVNTRADPDFQEFNEEMGEVGDLTMHLTAAGHGHGRPHFSARGILDPEPNGCDLAALVAEVPRRFGRLQRKYGRWGLAYLESLLRAADYAASAEPSKTVEEESR